MVALFMSYGIDVLLISVFVINVITSIRKGFLKCVLSIVCVIASLAVAMTFSQSAAEWSYDNLLSGYVVAKVENAVEDGLSSMTAAQTVSQIVESVPQFLIEQLEEFGIDVNSVSKNVSSMQLSAYDTAEKISTDIIRPGAVVLLKIVCFVLIFLAVRFVLGLLTKFFDGFAKLPLLKHVNKWLGAATGAVKGVVIVFILCTALNAIVMIVPDNKTIINAVENSRICNLIENSEITDLSQFDLYSITE